jgi:glycosyltransferase involved in cell wall biosynthesis
MKKRICLNMIVKDESRVIERCLASVKKIIDYWVIVDTGSTDNSQEIIAECMRDIPGQLYERPWVDFALNRNEAMELARGLGDYLFFIDADERLEFADDFVMPPLDKDAYYIASLLPNHVQFYRMLLVNQHLKWKWEGALHEALYSPELGRTCAIMSGVTNIATANDGHRSQDPKKFQKDAQILEKELKKEPGNRRTVFFLAQTYFQAGEYRSSLKNYLKRASMGGFDEEIYFSYYMAGRLQEKLQMAPERFLAQYQKAAELKPWRAEPIFRIAHYFHGQTQYQRAYDLIRPVLKLPIPNDGLNIERDIYEFGLKILFIDCAQRLMKDIEAQEILQTLSLEKQAWFIEPRDNR